MPSQNCPVFSNVTSPVSRTSDFQNRSLKNNFIYEGNLWCLKSKIHKTKRL